MPIESKRSSMSKIRVISEGLIKLDSIASIPDPPEIKRKKRPEKKTRLGLILVFISVITIHIMVIITKYLI